MPADPAKCCDEDEDCATPDQCAAGACKPGPWNDEKCKCKTTKDCNDDDKFNGHEICSPFSQQPWLMQSAMSKSECMTMPGTQSDCGKLVHPDCGKATCFPSTGGCKVEPAPPGTPCRYWDSTTGRCEWSACGGDHKCKGQGMCPCSMDAQCAPCPGGAKAACDKAHDPPRCICIPG